MTARPLKEMREKAAAETATPTPSEATLLIEQAKTPTIEQQMETLRFRLNGLSSQVAFLREMLLNHQHTLVAEDAEGGVVLPARMVRSIELPGERTRCPR